MIVFKAAVLLGAPEDRASKEMGEVIDFMGKLFNLTKNFCSKASENYSKTLSRMKQMLNSPGLLEPSLSSISPSEPLS